MLLATDLDGTFLAGESEKRHQLYQLISHYPEIQLVYATGRGLESVMPILADPTIPNPDYIICDVGATIVDGKELLPVQPLQSQIDESWPGEYVIEQAVSHLTGLQRQEVPQERRCSFYCKPEAVTEEIYQIADSLDCDVLYSSERYLDFLPRRVNKGSSLALLIEHLELESDEVLVAGDTLNDLALFDKGYLGVCVGRSEKGLLEATASLEGVFHAKASGCGGILEAITHFDLLSEKHLKRGLRQKVAPGTSDLVIVYHRLPYEEYVEGGLVKQRQPRSPNGIIPTLLSFFADGKQGSWIAWSTVADEVRNFEPHTTVDSERYPNLTATKVSLDRDEVDIFYKQFSKEAFWPTLHTFWEQATFREEHWQVFREVNRKFARQAAEQAALNAVVWIHDYNLWMVPALLREMRPDLRIAFFHHTYFPSADVFNVLPWRKEIVGSLLQCDFVGFHIPRQSENFVDVARGVTPLNIIERSNCSPRFLTYGCAVGLDEMTTVIEAAGRTIRLGALPVGLDIGRVERALADNKVRQKAEQLRKDFGDCKILFSVERLDYTKGILPKLEAFERLLEQYPDLQGDVTLVTICVPAAKEMTIYDELQIQIEQTVGRINGRFARVGWTPIQFFFRSYPFEELVAFYSMVDVMWITPLRDGLNLVAKEFIATQGLVQGNGVLVLSEFAGAAAELRGALLTNPHDPSDLVNTCYQALTMDEEEAANRIRDGFEVVKHNDIDNWGAEFMAVIDQCEVSESTS